MAFLDSGGALPVEEIPATIGPLFEARDAWERRYIETALARCDGNISRTADVLGLERSNLYKKMRSLGMSAGRDG
jgi:two-component system nitrogen regulation response regulator NtrX